MLCNKRKRRYLGVFAALAVMTLFSLKVSAQDDIDAFVGGELSVGRCAAKGNIDFELFLNASSYSDGFYESFFEPWKDILDRNQCHSVDVGNLVKQRDSIRKFIRDAFLTCNTERLPSLEQAFWKLNAEIYYVRHVVDEDVVSGLPNNVLAGKMEKEPDFLLYPREKNSMMRCFRAMLRKAS